VVLALLLITHQGYAALTLQIWAFWVMIRSLLRTPRPTRSSLLWLSSGLGAGFGLAAFFLVPSIALADWAFLGSRPPILLPGVPTADLFRRLLIWNNTWSGWSAAYIGLTAIGIATWGVLRALRRGRRDEVLSLLTPLVLIGWILLCTATTERVIHLVLPFLALMVGLSLRQLGSRSRIGVVLLVVLAIDLGPTIIQAPFRTDLQARDHALAEFSKATYPHRVLLATSEAGKTNVMTWPNLGDPVLRTPNGGFPQGAPPGHLSAIALIDALNSPEIEFSRTTNLRALWDVTGLLLLNLGLDGEPVEMVAYQEPTPMIYSTRVETLDDPGMVWDLAISPQMLNEDDFRRREMMAATIAASETMRMDLEQLNAEVLFLAPNDDERVSSAGFNRNGRGVGSATVRSLSMDVGASQVRQRFSIPDPGWIRLPFSYSKFLRLSLDGEVVKPFEGAFGGTIIPVEAGVHDILIETKRLMIDQLAVAISLGLALTLIIANLRFRLD
jgi:hypothetical protein